MSEYEYDVVVIGTGPGGEGAAMQAVKQGKRVAVVERHELIGGGCTHWGTIPSKALRYAISRMCEANANPLFRSAGVSLDLEFSQLRKGAQSVIDRQVQMRTGFYLRNDVPIVRGQAGFVDEHTIDAVQGDGGRTRITAEFFVVAPGARPYHPPHVDFDHPRVFDSDTILGLEKTPRSITIYGAGVIGCEYASMFRNLGCKVNLVNTRDKLLDFLDDEIIDALSYHLRDRGVILRHGETIGHVEGESDGVVLHLQSGKQLKTDILLWAMGRTGNSDGMNLEGIGIEPDQRGQLPVDEHFRTCQPHVYAVGDITGPPALASAAYVQGRYAASHLIDGEAAQRMILDIPTGIYTSPEISSIGKTEKELTEQRIPYEVGISSFKHLARAQILNQSVGMLKLLFHRDTLAILGVHCFGANASEIVHIGQAIMSQEGEANTLNYFIDSTFNYPTMAEAYRVAALNGYNRLF